MSDEMKDQGAAETAAENMAAAAEGIADVFPTAGEAAATDEAMCAAGSTKKGKAKGTGKGKQVEGEATGALHSVGLDACKRHGIAEVWVTADGQSFPQSGDAKAHAANLNDKQILKVTAE